MHKTTRRFEENRLISTMQILLFLIFYFILTCTLTSMRFQDMTKANMVDEVANKNQKTFSQTRLESTHQWYP